MRFASHCFYYKTVLSMAMAKKCTFYIGLLNVMKGMNTLRPARGSGLNSRYNQSSDLTSGWRVSSVE